VYPGEHSDTAAIEPLLSVADVCRALGVSRGTVYNLVRSGELVPSYCAGSHPPLEPGELRDLIRRRRRSRPEPGEVDPHPVVPEERWRQRRAYHDGPGHLRRDPLAATPARH
jgi:excisionase family DNA binding protein